MRDDKTIPRSSKQVYVHLEVDLRRQKAETIPVCSN